jgi:hypothetical protein
MNTTIDLCPWCGEAYLLDLLEVWPDDRAWLFSTCCEVAHQEVLLELADDPACATALLRPLFESYGIPIRSIYPDLESLRLDFGLKLCPITFKEACNFIDAHHEHHPAPQGWRWGHGVRNGHDLVGVATVGRPVARAYDPRYVVEVTRACTNRNLHSAVTRHAASMLYGAAARSARARGFGRIITYTLEDEPGTSLIAAGWVPERRVRGKSWSAPSRPRIDRAPTCPKVRWAKDLRRTSPVQRELFRPVPQRLPN